MTRLQTPPEADLLVWLGPAADTCTPDQLEAVYAADRAISRRYGDSDQAESALSAAVQVILGDATVDELAEARFRARLAEREAMAALSGAIIAAVQAGESENALSSRLGLPRDTVRKALGK